MQSNELISLGVHLAMVCTPASATAETTSPWITTMPPTTTWEDCMWSKDLVTWYCSVPLAEQHTAWSSFWDMDGSGMASSSWKSNTIRAGSPFFLEQSTGTCFPPLGGEPSICEGGLQPYAHWSVEVFSLRICFIEGHRRRYISQDHQILIPLSVTMSCLDVVGVDQLKSVR